MKTENIEPRASGNEQPASGVSAEQIAEWKAQNPRGVWEVTVDGVAAYVRKPNRNEMKAAMTKATQNDPLGMVEDILDFCWLGGDEAIKTDDDLFYGAAMQLQELIQIKAGELKKL